MATSEISFKDGTVPYTSPHIDVPCETFYRTFGDLSSNSPRLVIIHGGPGTGHEYLLHFASLWERYQIPVVFYDQIGCGSSTRLPQTEGNQSLWQEEHFLAELDNLIDALHLRDGLGFHLLGHSWGGRLAPAYAARRPHGLRRLIIASGLASSETAMKGVQMNRQLLPPEIQAMLNEEEAKGQFDSARFQEGMKTYYRTYFCRAEPFPPPELLPAFQNMSEDKTQRATMYGPNPFKTEGTLRDWTCIPRLHQIEVPTLVYNGEFDTSPDITTVPFFENIPRVRWVTFSGAGHMCHLEGPTIREKVMTTVGEFLAQK